MYEEGLIKQVLQNNQHHMKRNYFTFGSLHCCITPSTSYMLVVDRFQTQVPFYLYKGKKVLLDKDKYSYCLPRNTQHVDISHGERTLT